MRYKVLITGEPGVTEKVATTDTAVLLTSLLTMDSSKEAIGVLLTVETNPIRFAFGGTTPAQAGAGHMLSAGQSLKLISPTQVSSMMVISHTNGSHAALHVTVEYNI